MKTPRHLKRLYNIIIDNLPEKYRYDVKICRNGKDIFREMKARDGIKDNVSKLEEMSKDECVILQEKIGKHTQIFNERFPQIKNRRGVVFFAFSGSPILLNSYALKRESIEFVAATILHEVGHNAGYLTEDMADKFALRWMDKIWDKVRKEYYGY